MKVCWIVLCFNEMDILPFVRKYWERVADKVVVFDNHSTDGSIEYLKKIPYVELRHFETNGQNDIIQKQIKEQAYLEFKDQFDFIIISDMDEVFYFNNFTGALDKMIEENANVLATPIYSLCEDNKPTPEEDKLLHQQCHKFYKQRMNHMDKFDDISKLSIFNCHNVDKIYMSVGQHIVQTMPLMRVMFLKDAFCLHIDKGFGADYRYNIKHKMNENLSEDNKKFGMCVEYGDSYEKMKREYENNQENSFDINVIYDDKHNNN